MASTADTANETSQEERGPQGARTVDAAPLVRPPSTAERLKTEPGQLPVPQTSV